MPFDIYGQPLRSRHCEVHPDVHETYPCQVCLAEAERDAEMFRDYERECEEQAEEYYREMFEAMLENMGGDGI
jgi:hypothetical protein